MAGIGEAFKSFNIGNAGIYALWLFIFLVVAFVVAVMVVVVMVKKSQKKLVIIDMQNRRLDITNGRTKKTKQGVKQFWGGNKLKRFLPQFQSKDTFTKGKQDAIILLKDNNGLIHTARIPTWKELKKWYEAVYGIDITDSEKHSKLRNIYLLPSPHEDVNWFANECTQADKEFSITSWWSSPTVAYIATGFICLMMIVMTMIIEKKF